MPNASWRKVFQQLRKSALLSDGAGLSDAQLLDCFLNDGDEDAFAALVRRHGPMVFGVCRRLLPSWQDAEDAFQATFLVLARKAAAIQPRRQVGNWLYGVAYRTALEAKTILAKRRAKERPLHDVAQPEPADESWRELQPILDSELNRLPDKYRIVIVCCDLQGKTRKEAAGQLGWPEGTVAARLARGRSLLRARLIRRGLTFSVGSSAALISHNGALACVAKALEACTVKAAAVVAAGTTMETGLVSVHVAILTQGVLKSMFVTKLKFAAGLLIALGVIGFGTGVGMYAGGAQPTDAAPSVAAERPQAELANGVKPPLEVPEVDQTKAVEEIAKQRTANIEEDGRESKKKVEKKKRHHEDDEDDSDDDREVKKASKKKRGHEDEDEDDDRDRGRESKKKAGAKKREHEDDEDDDRGREIKKKGSRKKREHEEDEDDDRGHKSKKKAGAKKREHEDDEDDEHAEMKKARKREHEDGEKKGRKTEKAGKKKREHEEEEDDHREHAKKKSSAEKRQHEDDAEHREVKKKGKTKSRRHEDDEDDNREGKKKAKKGKRHHKDDEAEHAREGKKKDKAKKRGHEDDDDRHEHKKKAGKKKREHEDDEDEGREGKKKRRDKDE